MLVGFQLLFESIDCCNLLLSRFSPRLQKAPMSLLLITIASLLVVNFFGKFTYVLFIAATITVIYSEISFLLGKYFFPNFVGENISKEIIYMFSFIVFINAGYFTFMLILDILKAETVI